MADAGLASRLPNVWIPYIKVTFSDISLTWRAQEGRPDYFVNLSHKRVVEASPDMTLKITYAPKYGENPNKIEDAIVRSRGLCLVQYGFIAGWSKLYKAIVYSYNVNFNEGVLEYTFKLLSEAVIYNKDTKVPAYSNYRLSKIRGRNNQRAIILATSSDIVSHIEQVVKTYMSGKGIYPGYEFDRSTSTGLGEMIVPVAKFTTGANLNPIDHIKQILEKVKSSDKDATYQVDVDDSGSGKGRVRICKVGGESKKVEKFQFDWGKRDGTVLSFSPGFDGAGVIFSVGSGKDIKDGGANSVNSDVDEATSKQYTMLTRSQVSRDALNNFDTLDNLSVVSETVRDIVKKENFSYNATLTVVAAEGQSKFETGETVVYVNPLIQGKPHHSAGYYFINAATDNVSSQGFTTTYDLRRLSAEEIYSQLKVGKIYRTIGVIGADRFSSSDSCIYVDGEFVNTESYDPHASVGVLSPDRTNADYAYNANPIVAPKEVPGGFSWPAPGVSRITSKFGKRSYTNSQGVVVSDYHTGVDIGCPKGTMIYASAPGKITIADYSSSYGWYVEVDHGNGFKTRYAHGSQKPLVSVGQQVVQGSKILISGDTGNVTGPHLHYEVRYNTVPQDPLNYIKYE